MIYEFNGTFIIQLRIFMEICINCISNVRTHGLHRFIKIFSTIAQEFTVHLHSSNISLQTTSDHCPIVKPQRKYILFLLFVRNSRNTSTGVLRRNDRTEKSKWPHFRDQSSTVRTSRSLRRARLASTTRVRSH